MLYDVTLTIHMDAPDKTIAWQRAVRLLMNTRPRELSSVAVVRIEETNPAVPSPLPSQQGLFYD